MPRKRSLIWKLSTNEFKELISKSNSLNQVLQFFSLNTNGGNYTTLRQRIKEENIDISHFNPYTYGILNNRKPKQHRNLSEILVENSACDRGHLKKRLLKEKLLENKCKICGQEPFWEGKKMTLVLDHINGINNDNRFENLRLVCPNCNSQLDTFCGRRKHYVLRCETAQDIPISIVKNKKENSIKKCVDCSKQISKNGFRCKSCNASQQPRKAARPTKEVLEQLIKTTPMTHIGKMFGVSDNAVKKWAKRYNIVLENRLGYWQKKYANKI